MWQILKLIEYVLICSFLCHLIWFQFTKHQPNCSRFQNVTLLCKRHHLCQNVSRKWKITPKNWQTLIYFHIFYMQSFLRNWKIAQINHIHTEFHQKSLILNKKFHFMLLCVWKKTLNHYQTFSCFVWITQLKTPFTFNEQAEKFVFCEMASFFRLEGSSYQLSRVWGVAIFSMKQR